MDQVTFVAFMVEDTDAPRRETVTKIALITASPTEPNSNTNMVQVAHNPLEDQNGTTSSPESQTDLKTNLSSVTEDAYRVVTSSMMADPLTQTNPAIALGLLETALINRNVPIAKHYIENLKGLIRKDNALKMLISIGRWIHSSEADQQMNFEPSAPPLVDNNEERNDSWMKEPLSRLRDNILLEIDKDGDYFLKHKEFQELHYQDVLGITTRDELQVSSEVVVYCAIMKWAEAECQRKGLGWEDVNIKAVLKDLIYAPRYGLMSKKEFRTRTMDGFRGPDRIGIPAETNEKILEYLQNKNKKRPVKELPYKMSRSRKLGGRKSAETDTMAEKVIVNCLTCFSAVFD